MKVLDRDGQALMPWGSPETAAGPGAEIVVLGDEDDAEDTPGADGEDAPIEAVPFDEISEVGEELPEEPTELIPPR